MINKLNVYAPYKAILHEVIYGILRFKQVELDTFVST